jgi:transcriptional regulator with XRE-family HTH domain
MRRRGIPVPDVGRRPVEESERPYLIAFGTKLRNLRNRAGLTQADLAVGAMVKPLHIQRLENARRRPRPSTIRRLADALALASPSLPPHVLGGDRPDVMPAPMISKELMVTAGPALAPESEHRDRIERRRDRRQRKIAHALEDEDRIAELVADEVMVIAPVLAEQMFEDKVRRHEAAKRQAAIRAQKRKEGLAPKRRTKMEPTGGSGGVTLEP